MHQLLVESDLQRRQWAVLVVHANQAPSFPRSLPTVVSYCGLAIGKSAQDGVFSPNGRAVLQFGVSRKLEFRHHLACADPHPTCLT